MTLTVRTTSLGPDALDVLAEELRAAKAGDPLAPCTVVVPSNSMGVSVRRRLASGVAGPICGPSPGLVGVNFLTVYRLAELIAAPFLAAANRRPVSTPVVLSAIGAVLRDDAGFFVAVRDHDATRRALLSTYRELREVDESDLSTLATCSARTADVVRVARAVHERLGSAWYDEADLMDTASDLLARDPGLLATHGPVVLHLPGETTPSATRLLGSVAAHGSLVVTAGVTGIRTADAPITRLLTRLGAPAPEPVGAPLPVADRLAHAADAEDEVRVAVRRIVEALHADNPIPAERIAVVHASAEPYAPILEQQLNAAGIRHNGYVGRPLGHSLAGRMLLSTLRRARAADGLGRIELFRFLSGVPQRGGDRRLIPVALWERESRDLGVVKRVEDWRAATANDRERRHAEIERVAPEVDAGRTEEWVLENLRSGLGLLDELSEFIEREATELDELRSASTWAALAAVCDRRLRRVWLPPRSDDAFGVEERALDSASRLVESVSGLDGIDDWPSPAAMLQLLEADVQRPTRRGALGDGVLVGTIGATAGLDLDLVIALGLAEGEFPGRPSEDSLLLDSERAVVGDTLAPSRAVIERRHSELLAAIAAGSNGTVVLSWPRGDLRRSARRIPSRWVVDQARALAGDEDLTADRLETLDEPWVEPCPSFVGGLRSVAIPATAQEYRLAAVSRTHRVPTIGPAFSSAAFHRGVELVRARESDQLTRFDGLLEPGSVPSPADATRAIAPTTLERWRGCPHAYLLNDVLRVRYIEEAEDRYDISPMDQGTLMHTIMERWLEGRLGRGQAPGDAWSDADHSDLDELIDTEFAVAVEKGLTGRPALWEQSAINIRRWLHRALYQDDSRRVAGGLTPHLVEWTFGIGSGAEPYEFELEDGRRLRIRGKVDRIDVTSSGSLVICDYKGKPKRKSIDFSGDDLTSGGIYLQLPIYALAAADGLGISGDEHRGEYWYLVDDAAERSSASLTLTADRLETVRKRVTQMVELIEAGVFVNVPEEPGWKMFVSCHYCDPDGLGTDDVHRRWERKQADSRLVRFLELISPSEDGDPTAAPAGSTASGTVAAQ